MLEYIGRGSSKPGLERHSADMEIFLQIPSFFRRWIESEQVWKIEYPNICYSRVQRKNNGTIKKGR